MYRSKNNTPIRFAAVTLLAMVTGCLEYETTTTVRPDGSFVRSLTVRGDSLALHTWDFKVPADSSWKVVELSKVDDKKWTLRAERPFGSVDEWAAWSDGIDRRVLRCSVSVEKQFRVFTTTYRFTETIKAYNPFTLVPVTDFISQAELEMFLRFEVLKEGYPNRGDSLALEDAGDRFEEWEVRTRVASTFQALRKHLPADAGLSPDRLAELEERMADDFLKDGKDDSFSPEGVYTWARKTRERALMRAAEAASEDLASIKRDIDFIQSVGGDAYMSRVALPGEITVTNGKPEGTSAAVWDDYIAYAYVRDFTMVAESSVVNVWAIVLMLGVIVGLPILVWVAWMVRKKGGLRKD